MDEDDWRNWKDGKYDNRYHGVRRHQGKKYYRRGKSKALLIAIIVIGLVAVSLVVLVGIPGLPKLDLSNLIGTILTHPPPATQDKGQTNLPSSDTSQVVLSNCIMASNGVGGIRINCANHDSVQCTSNPPIGSGIQKDVTLTIDKNSCIVQFPNPQGSNTIYHFQLGASPTTTNTGTTNNPVTSTPPSNHIPLVTFPKITFPKVAIPSITIPGSSNDQSSTPPTDLPTLYAYALKIVNDDRKAAGLNPVALSNTPSAQNHADDQLSLRYFSHWDSNGAKPYVVYTKLGGRGSVAENNYYTYSYCPSSNCIENTYDPYVEIKKGENEMLNNDAASNWGHRNNILDPHHTHVNFGIAYDHNRFYFVENFENNLVNWQTMELRGGSLLLIGTIQPGYAMDSIDIFSDPSPTKLTENDLDNSPPYNAGFYDQGTDAGMIVPKPTGNSFYPECSPGKITATFPDGTSQCLDYSMYANISPNQNGINALIDVSKWSNSEGLHTIYVNMKDSTGKTVPATSLTLEYLK